MAEQHGNIYTGKFRDIASNYLTPHHMYFAYDTKELYSFNPDKTPYLLFNQDNEVKVIQIHSSELPDGYTKQDVLDYLNTKGFEKEEIDTIAVEIVGGYEIGESYPIDWGFISGKPVVFPPAPHTHSYNDLTDKPDLTNIGGRSDEEIKGIIKNFLVDGEGVNIVYDSELNVLRFDVSGITDEMMNQENINIVVNISREALITVDDEGIVQYLNTLNPPLLIDGTHNVYFNLAEEGSTQFDYDFDFNLE